MQHGLASEQCSRARGPCSPSQPSALPRGQAACRCMCQRSGGAQQSAGPPPSRRQVLAAPLAAAVLAATLQQRQPALAFSPPVQGHTSLHSSRWLTGPRIKAEAHASAFALLRVHTWWQDRPSPRREQQVLTFAAALRRPTEA